MSWSAACLELHPLFSSKKSSRSIFLDSIIWFHDAKSLLEYILGSMLMNSRVKKKYKRNKFSTFTTASTWHLKYFSFFLPCTSRSRLASRIRHIYLMLPGSEGSPSFYRCRDGRNSLGYILGLLRGLVSRASIMQRGEKRAAIIRQWRYKHRVCI